MKILIKNDKSLVDLSDMFNAVLKGWFNYYGQFYSSAMNPIWRHLNWYLIQWVRRKYKRLNGHKRRAREYVNRMAHENPTLYFALETWRIFRG